MTIQNFRIIILFAIASFATSASYSQTQLELNTNAYNAFVKVDKELNDTYSLILKKYKADTAFLKNLRTSQRLWIQFRDAEVKMKFPDREPGYYGSSHSMCVANYKEELTRERIKKLELWLKGSAEGDMCSGSININ